MNRVKTLMLGLPLLALTTALWGEQDPAAPSFAEGADEMDRPGEIENPFTLPAGRLELVNYLVAANAAAREDDLGCEGSAVFMDTALRLGVCPRVEAEVAVDSFLGESTLRGRRPAVGFGYATLAAKWNVLRDAAGDFGISVAPLVRLPLDQAIGGSARAAAGISLPFDFDLEGGWELQGSVSILRSPEGARDWAEQWENQLGVERTLTRALTAYLELEAELGDGATAWSTEFGVNWRVSRRVLADMGTSIGLGSSRARMSYVGLGLSF